MRCASMPELLHTVIHESRTDTGWDLASLTLYDPEYTLHRLLDSTSTLRSDFPELFLTNDLSHLETVFDHARRPVLGHYRARSHATLFPKTDQRPGSVAILPLIRNRKLIGSLNLGSFDPDRFKPEIATDFMEHLAAVVSVCLETAEIREQLRFIGLMDGLTGVNNRRFFDQRLHEEVERVRRDGVSLGCLFIDLDHFKKINDTFGHQVGDDVLRTVAQLIREQLRTIDVVTRYGGEEFAVLLTHADLALSVEIAERIRLSIKQWEFAAQEQEIEISVSIGVATTEHTSISDNMQEMARRLVEAADQAVYCAKESGRNRVVTYNGTGV